MSASVLDNDRLLRALRREPVDRTPVWIMRQAGRYLPEYRRVRADAGDFLTLCRTPELACEVTLQPVLRFGLDAAILFSDILTVPDAMGLGLSVEEGFGPRFAHPVRDRTAIERLPVPDPERELRYVMDATRLIARELAGRVPLIGFAGSPWTLATYMVEGGSSRDFRHIKTLVYDDAQAARALLTRLADAVGEYLAAQASAGADCLMIFDTWGGVLGPRDYGRFSLEPMQRIVQRLKRDRSIAGKPVILFTKGGGQWLERMADTGCDALGLDWTTDIGEARRRVGDRVALQGNLDPAVLHASPARIKQEVAAVLAAWGPGPGHVFNLGHGIQPETDPGHLAVLVECVREQSPAYHRAGDGT